MQAMVCELCNSNDIVKSDGVYVCQHCGTKYTVEEAKKLIGTVKIDKSEETEKYLTLARRARDEENIENAIKYYDMVLRDNPDNWEASFYQVYFQAMNCKIAGISNAATSVTNTIKPTFKLIKENVANDEQQKAVVEVMMRAISLATMLANAANNHYSKHSTVNTAREELNNRLFCAGSIYLEIENGLKEFFPDEERILTLHQQTCNSYFSSTNGSCLNSDFRTKLINRLVNEIHQKDPTYTAPTVQSGGCYVATCVYGSYDCPQVWVLRRFRDYTLGSTWYGRMFVSGYYAVSPTIVRLFGEQERFKTFWKHLLDKLVNRLQEKGVSDKPYLDREW